MSRLRNGQFGRSAKNRKGGGELLEGPEIDIETRPAIAECPLGYDFGQLCREVAEFLGQKKRGVVMVRPAVKLR